MAHRHKSQAVKLRREVDTTRRRFVILIAIMMAVLGSALVAELYLNAQAGNPVTVSGRVYNATTGAGYAGVTIYLCNSNGTVMTDGTGAFHKDLGQGAVYCVRIANFPFSAAGLTGPRATSNNASVGAQSSYENQVAEVNCAANTSCTDSQQQWDRNFQNTKSEGGFDLAYSGTSAPAAATASKAQSAPAAPAGGPTPSIPGNFQATVSSSNSTVTLSWGVSTASAGIKNYVLDRSVDQNTWTTIAADLSATTFVDSSVDFGVHYYYRIKAVDQAGNSSGYASTDANTGDFQSSDNSSGGGTTVSSDDGVAVVEMAEGTFEGEVDCTVSLVTDSGSTSSGHPVAAGPYSLICKTLSGKLVTTFDKPVTWTYNLQGKLTGLNNPVAFSFPSGGNPKAVPSQKFDPASVVLKFNTTTSDDTEVLASKVQGVSINVVTAIFVVIVIMVGLAILMVQRNKRLVYEDYLRRKYYNL